MIFTTGRLNPSKHHLLEARQKADSTFCVSASDEFMQDFPTVLGWKPAGMTATLLKLKCVEPHDDPFVGGGEEPTVRRAIFWLLRGGGIDYRQPLIFGCGAMSVKMRPGNYVVFDDTITHWVMSEKVWYGAALQLREL
mgnify:CR=1 FL=1